MWASSTAYPEVWSFLSELVISLSLSTPMLHGSHLQEEEVEESGVSGGGTAHPHGSHPAHGIVFFLPAVFPDALHFCFFFFLLTLLL